MTLELTAGSSAFGLLTRRGCIACPVSVLYVCQLPSILYGVCDSQAFRCCMSALKEQQHLIQSERYLTVVIVGESADHPPNQRKYCHHLLVLQLETLEPKKD